MKPQKTQNLFLTKITIVFLIILAIANTISCDKGTDSPTPKPIDEVIKADASLIDVANEQQIIRGFGAATVFRLDTLLNNSDLDLLLEIV